MDQSQILRTVLLDLLPTHRFFSEVVDNVFALYLYDEENQTKQEGFMIWKIIDSDPNYIEEAHWAIFKNAVAFISKQ